MQMVNNNVTLESVKWTGQFGFIVQNVKDLGPDKGQYGYQLSI